jgi:hypothetical protein
MITAWRGEGLDDEHLFGSDAGAQVDVVVVIGELADNGLAEPQSQTSGDFCGEIRVGRTAEDERVINSGFAIGYLPYIIGLDHVLLSQVSQLLFCNSLAF